MTNAVRWLSVVTAVLVLIQALLIGQALYVNGMSTVGLHGMLGNVTFLGGIILTAAAYMAYRRGELGSTTLGLSILVLVLLVAQLGLGYSGRGGGTPAALHIPNGVLISGLLFAITALSFGPRADAGQFRA